MVLGTDSIRQIIYPCQRHPIEGSLDAMIRINIPPKRLAQKGIENAFQLAHAAGIGYPTAAKLMKETMSGVRPGAEKIDVRALEAVARALGVKPLSLLEYVPESAS